jgi:predicted dinucleotide-binding enzyme
MKIGMLGSGMVGRILAAGLVARDHSVVLGSRTPGRAELTRWREQTGEQACSGSIAEAAAFGEIAFLATDWAGTEEAIELAGPGRLSGKVVVDVTNPLDFSSGMPPRLDLGHADSGGEQVQRWLPGARVVKAFNTVPAERMVDPDGGRGRPVLFMAGNDSEAKAVVAELARSLGWYPADAGPLRHARLLEPLALLWITQRLAGGADYEIIRTNEAEASAGER